MKKVLFILTVIIFSCANLYGQPDPSCCEGMRGDINGNGDLDITDITCLINHLYLSHDPIVCFEEADVNADGELDISDITCIITEVYIDKMSSCIQPCPGYIEPFGSLDSYNGCKSFEKAADTVTSADDCLMYEYDGMTLNMKHVNAGFNCCVDNLGAHITIEDNVITLDEYEINPNCYCLCLYDLYYVFYNLLPGEYTIIVKEPYVYSIEGREEIEFTVNLQPGLTGGYCVERLYYPWGY
ncbi:MAG: hypothetical protein JXA92_14300 [candidate division Zixibacteria bacterium]|nr:hypothetical protein [candidate division Zixibacteria bacterium]